MYVCIYVISLDVGVAIVDCCQRRESWVQAPQSAAARDASDGSYPEQRSGARQVATDNQIAGALNGACHSEGRQCVTRASCHAPPPPLSRDVRGRLWATYH